VGTAHNNTGTPHAPHPLNATGETTPADSEPVLVYYLSDSTGVTAETLGTSLLAQFPRHTFVEKTIPFITSVDHAADVVARVDEKVAAGRSVIVLCTAIDPRIRAVLAGTRATVVDFFSSHIHTMEKALNSRALYATGRAHGQGDAVIYQRRMRAIEYAIEHDDAQSIRNLDAAEVILIGPSRCGKTPTSMYLALQHGLFVANFPLLEEDYDASGLPAPLHGLERRCVGITTTPLRLSQVRGERRPHSRYASLEQCTFEIRRAESLYRTQRIPTLSSATTSVEEMSAIILHTMNLPGIDEQLLNSAIQHGAPVTSTSPPSRLTGAPGPAAGHAPRHPTPPIRTEQR